MMHSPMKTLLAATISLGLSAPAMAADADTVVATVGGQEITLGHMIVMTSQLPKQYTQLPDDVLYKAVLDQLIRQTAAAQTVKDHLSTEAKIALENQRTAFLAGEALNAVAEEAVSEEAIQKAYDAKYASVEPAKEFNASHILVEGEDEARAIAKKLADGADFAKLAKDNSTGPSSESGGTLGWFSEGMMVKPFEDAVMAMETGEVSDPVKTRFGWHIIKLNETRQKPVPALEEVRAEIVDTLKQEAVNEAIEKMTAQTEVTRSKEEIDPATLRNMELLKN